MNHKGTLNDIISLLVRKKIPIKSIELSAGVSNGLSCERKSGIFEQVIE